MNTGIPKGLLSLLSREHTPSYLLSLLSRKHTLSYLLSLLSREHTLSYLLSLLSREHTLSVIHAYCRFPCKGGDMDRCANHDTDPPFWNHQLYFVSWNSPCVSTVSPPHHNYHHHASTHSQVCYDLFHPAVKFIPQTQQQSLIIQLSPGCRNCSRCASVVSLST